MSDSNVTGRSRFSCCKTCCKICICSVVLVVMIWIGLTVFIPFMISKDPNIYPTDLTTQDAEVVHTEETPRRVERRDKAMSLRHTRPDLEASDEGELHYHQMKNRTHLNVFANLLVHYVEAMEIEDCYVCMMLPTSVAEGVTYHHLPLTYGISCSILASLFYRSTLQYYYSNTDVIFSELPIRGNLNLVHTLGGVTRYMGEYFLTIGDIDLNEARRDNLTCSLHAQEKMFLKMAEKRREKFQKKANDEKNRTPRWAENMDNTSQSEVTPALLLDFERKGKLCLHREKTSYYNNVFIGSSECEHNYKVIGGWGFKNGSEPVFPGIYYICGNKAYFKLPDHWYGSCYFGIVFPKIYHVNNAAGSNENTNGLVRRKRESVGEIIGDIFSALIPGMGVVLNTHRICKLSTVVDRLSTDTAAGFLMVNTEMVAIRSMVLQNRLALDTLLAKEGGVCRMLKAQHCCTYIPDKSVEIKKYVRNITNLEKELKPLEVDSAWKRLTDGLSSVGSWFSNLGKSLIWKILMPIAGIGLIVLIIFICCKCQKCRKYIVNKRGKRKAEELELEELRNQIYKKIKNNHTHREAERKLNNKFIEVEMDELDE